MMSHTCAFGNKVESKGILPGSRKDTVEKLYAYLGAKIPLNVMVLYLCDISSGVMSLLSVATEQGAVVCNERRFLSNSALGEYKNILQHKTYNFAVESSYAANEFLIDFPIPRPFSAMNVHMKLRKKVYACLGICCNALENYGKPHLAALHFEYEKLKNWLCDILRKFEKKAQSRQRVEERNAILRRLELLGKECIVGADSGLKKVLEMARQVAPFNSTVLITGDTGSGKEVLANAIHRMSSRFSGPFVSVNCGAIPESLLDSELFGHEKGSFTNAHAMHKGFFEQADGGTIFLDEIGELPLAAQVKLLRLLQTLQFYRVGGNQPLSVDVRIIAATNRNLSEMVFNKTFRSDLLYRLNIYPIHVPPLNERKEDIPALAFHFAKFKAREMALPWQPKFAPSAIAQLQAHDWPGNVRELQNVVERKLILSQDSPMSFHDLHSSGILLDKGLSSKMTMADFPSLNSMIQKHIEEALSFSEGKIEGPGGAADLLDLPPSTLRAKMKKFGICR